MQLPKNRPKGRVVPPDPNPRMRCVKPPASYSTTLQRYPAAAGWLLELNAWTKHSAQRLRGLCELCERQTKSPLGQKYVEKSPPLLYLYAGENAELLHPFPLRMFSTDRIVFPKDLIAELIEHHQSKTSPQAEFNLIHKLSLANKTIIGRREALKRPMPGL